MIPGPDERLRERLATLPDACRFLLAALDREAARGGGEVQVRLSVGRDGQLYRLECATVFERRIGAGGAT